MQDSKPFIIYSGTVKFIKDNIESNNLIDSNKDIDIQPSIEKSNIEHKIKKSMKQIKDIEMKINNFKHEPLSSSILTLYKGILLNINLECNALYYDMKRYIHPTELVYFIQYQNILKDKCKQVSEKLHRLIIKVCKSELFGNTKTDLIPTDLIPTDLIPTDLITKAINTLDMGPNKNKSVEELLQDWKQYEIDYERYKKELKEQDPNDPNIIQQKKDLDKDMEDLKKEFHDAIKEMCKQRLNNQSLNRNIKDFLNDVNEFYEEEIDNEDKLL